MIHIIVQIKNDKQQKRASDRKLFKWHPSEHFNLYSIIGVKHKKEWLCSNWMDLKYSSQPFHTPSSRKQIKVIKLMPFPCLSLSTQIFIYSGYRFIKSWLWKIVHKKIWKRLRFFIQERKLPIQREKSKQHMSNFIAKFTRSYPELTEMSVWRTDIGLYRNTTWPN